MKAKPSKPYPDYPLFAHAMGYWAKSIKGKVHYFGRWNDPDGALEKYLKAKQSIDQGLLMPKINSLGDAAEAWISHKRQEKKKGALSSQTLQEYKRISKRIVECIGANVPLDDISESHITTLHSSLDGDCAAKTAQNNIRKARLLFNWLQSVGRWDVNKHKEVVSKLQVNGGGPSQADRRVSKIVNEARGIGILEKELDRPVTDWPSKNIVLREVLDLTEGAATLVSEIEKWWTGFSPDAYFIHKPTDTQICGWSQGMHHLCVVEIENTSPMTELKVQKYGLIWDVFNKSTEWRFHLIVVDRYEQWREMNLLKFYERAMSDRRVV
jgi:hypothetical protein